MLTDDGEVPVVGPVSLRYNKSNGTIEDDTHRRVYSLVAIVPLGGSFTLALAHDEPKEIGNDIITHIRFDRERARNGESGSRAGRKGPVDFRAKRRTTGALSEFTAYVPVLDRS
jgi:hypothetical protein